MIILCPYVEGGLRPETREALQPLKEAWFYQLPKDDQKAYGRLLGDMWRTAVDDTLIVEQDMLPTDEDIRLMRDCPEPYCAAPYELKTDVMPALGFTKFSREFMLKYPDAMDAAMEVSFRQVDVTLQRHYLVRHGEQPHIHPQIVHLNSLKKLLPDASPIPLSSLPAW